MSIQYLIPGKTKMKRLQDRFGRVHNYLRISLTDQCNLRCHYCMPGNAPYRSQGNFLTDEELIRIAGLFVYDFGITKIRITGGEPLVRKGAAGLIEALGKLPVELAITTNGVLLKNYFPLFEKIGLWSINISLDSLVSSCYSKITQRPFYKTVKSNIDEALQRGFRVKMNTVVMRGVNDREITDFVEWTRNSPLHIRFIEFMPFDGNNWRWSQVVPLSEMLDRIQSVYRVNRLTDKHCSTAKSYRVSGYRGTFAVISSVTEPFCTDCNRIRLTADGRLKNCLFSRDEVDLMTPLREGQDLAAAITDCIYDKQAARGGLAEMNDSRAKSAYEGGRCMTAIGG